MPEVISYGRFSSPLGTLIVVRPPIASPFDPGERRERLDGLRRAILRVTTKDGRQWLEAIGAWLFPERHFDGPNGIRALHGYDWRHDQGLAREAHQAIVEEAENAAREENERHQRWAKEAR